LEKNNIIGPIDSSKYSKSLEKNNIIGPIDSSKYSKSLEKNNIIGPKEYEELNFFSGSPAKPKDTLLSKLDKTQTLSGKAVLSLVLANPTNDVEILQERKEFLEFLIANKDLYKQLRNVLKIFKKIESSIISLYSYGDFLYSQFYYDKLFEDFYCAKNNGHAAKLELKKRITKNFLNVEFPLLYRFILPISYSICQPPIWESDFKQYIWWSSIPVASLIYKCFFFNSENLERILKNEDVNSFLSYGERFAHEIIYARFALFAWDNLKNYNEQIGILFKRMDEVRNFVRIIKNLGSITKKSDFQSLKDKTIAINSFFEKSHENLKLTKMLNKLIKLPRKSLSFFFNNTGNLLACFDLLGDVLHEFDEVIYEIGFLDTYVSIATLILENKDKKNNFCFPDFLKKENPFLNIRGLWNPFIDSDIAIGNDVNLDCEKEKTIVITGPNAGGKSSYTKGILYNTIMAQTFGIATAKRISLTPFAKISAYLNSVDKISSDDGKSLFVSNILDTRNFIKTLDNSNFSLCIFDDIFCGTDPQISEALEFSTIETLNDKFQNNLTIVSTHRSLITTLEKKENVKNYRVYITKDQNNNILYNYKIIKGVSIQRISIDLLRQNGYKNEIIYKASKMVEKFS
ncbi:MAG: hypothetical protein LBD32_00120, partial [Cytophagales bacterium]|jgi:energy-coupling factor transporter ATP-binding protein EcfA2|nr:hypothetical protein [Cytophagales bacterium]